MVAITWDGTGERFYETGTDRGVLYVRAAGTGDYGTGVAWNGLTAVSESPTGGEANPQYADNIKYLNLYSIEELEGTIEAFTFPDEFGVCDGSAEPQPGVYVGQQTRRGFGFSYRTLVGNDVDGNAHAYKLHLVYGAMASPSSKDYATVNDSPEAMTFSWDFTTTKVPVTGLEPTSSLTIDSRNVDEVSLASLEDILYGNDTTEARLPMPDEVITLLTPATAP